MDLKVGETYVMKKAETSSDGGITYLKKGTHVRLVSIGSSRVLVQDLSDDALTDGIWSTYADNLVTEEEYDAMVDDEEPEPIKLEEGAIYVMKRAEVSGDGLRTYIKKGARVRIESFGTLSVLVKDLSEDALDDGCWYTNPEYLVPIDKPEGSAAREEVEAEVAEKNKCVAPVVPLEDMVVVKNKHYVSEHQPIETMQSNMTHDEMIGFLKGNIIKYACRCGKKDEPLKEAEKIKQYAEWLCIVLSGGTIDPRS